MAELTLDALRKILHTAVGEDESIDLSGDILDAPLTELGVDSLVIIDATRRIEREFSIKLPDAEIGTPRDFLTVVNQQFAV